MKNPQQVADVYLAMFVCTVVFLAAITLLAIFYAFRYLLCHVCGTKFQAMFVGFLSSKPPRHFLSLQVCNSLKYQVMFVVGGSTKFQAMFVGFPYLPGLLAIFYAFRYETPQSIMPCVWEHKV